MAPVWFALRSETRRRWRALVSLALLLGLAGGVAGPAAPAGAQLVRDEQPDSEHTRSVRAIPGAR